TIYYLFIYWQIIFLVTGISYSANSANISLDKHEILIINSYHKGFSWTDSIVDSFINTIQKRNQSTEFYVEYLDTKRHFGKDHFDNFYHFIKSKYSEKNIDAIFVTDDDALNFVNNHHDELFSKKPVIYCGINNIVNARSLPKNTFTGIIEFQDIKSNIELILLLLPELVSIVFVTDGTTTGIGTRSEIQDSENIFPGINFIYYNGEEMNTEELIANLQKLDNKTAVLAPAWYLDKDGNYYDNTEIYPLLSKSCPVPIFSPSSANLGFGPVGGKMNNPATHGSLAAEYMLKILDEGLSPSDIAVNFKGYNDYMFDSAQLLRFNISEDTLPEQSIVINRPFSFYKTYKELVNSVIALFVIFVAFVITLVFIVRKLSRTKRFLSRNEELYRAVVEDAPVLICRFHHNGKVTFVNSAFADFIGEEAASIAGIDIASLLPDKDREFLMNQLGKFSVEEPLFVKELEIEIDGAMRWYRWVTRALFDETGKVHTYQTIGQDITNYKIIQSELRASLKEKEILLQEVHHRVKNNMQVIIALLTLQMTRSGSELNSVLKDIRNRMQIFADIHSNLYKHNNFTCINFKNHVKENFNNLCEIFGKSADKVKMVIDVNSPDFDLDIAIPCGLIMNELISNSFKHALGDSGEINIVIKRDNDGNIELLDYYDSGSVSKDYSVGFGTTIIDALSIQLQLNHKIYTEKNMRHIFTRKVQ
ncbi:MAG: PAS domain S-box protein, partial [Spirochaetes bacterium]|nr:PAS domain S-box protein [Spirochaetota bacterium]